MEHVRSLDEFYLRVTGSPVSKGCSYCHDGRGFKCDPVEVGVWAVELKESMEKVPGMYDETYTRMLGTLHRASLAHRSAQFYETLATLLDLILCYERP